MAKMDELIDQDARERFERDLDLNLCVSASAGAGKTTAIVRRIVRLATERGAQAAARLVVVTYGVLAAEELRLRARAELVLALGGGGVATQATLTSFNRAFFGTIHGFCLKLLMEEGRTFSLPARMSLAEEDDEILWQGFCGSRELEELNLDDAPCMAAFRHQTMDRLLKLARQLKPNEAIEILQREVPGAPPPIDASTALSPNVRGTSSLAEQLQEDLREWLARLKAGEPYLELPDYSHGGAAFQKAFQNALRDYALWANRCAEIAAARLCLVYRDYRRQHGVLSYDDMVIWTREMIENSAVLERLRQRNYIILLDEGQDADANMFAILTELARPQGAKPFAWPGDTNAPGPRPGFFSFVGDEQQCIYGERTDLRGYMEYVRAYREKRGGEAIEFRVTMRCPEPVVQAVNAVFPGRLDHTEVRFRELVARPDAGHGEAFRLALPVCEGNTQERFAAECRALAERIAAWGLEGLGVERWSDVAVLCPRVSWLEAASRELRAQGLPALLISQKERRREMPGWSWPAALLHCILYPDDRFELIGVLRELFGASDVELAELHLRAPLKLAPIAEPGLIGDAIRSLWALHESFASGARDGTLRLGAFVTRCMRETSLPERLEAIGEASDAIRALEDAALRAEAEGDDPMEWIRECVQNLNRKAASQGSGGNEINLLTCHKAKGLEWDVLILLGLERRLGEPSAEFPRVERRGARVRCHFQKFTVGETWKSEAEIARQEETLRLFYVAWTRARRKLIVCEERQGNPYGRGGAPWGELLKWEEARARMREAVTPCAESGRRSALPPVNGIDPPDRGILDKARAHASNIPQRVLPHELAAYDEFLQRDSEPVFTAGAGGVEYGTWWHEVVAALPWGASADEIAARADRAIASAVGEAIRERGGRELRALIDNRELMTRAAAAIRVLCEVPFSFPEKTDRWIEGVIDAVMVESRERILVLDWKTNRRESQESLDDFHWRLAAMYRAQLETYVDVLRGIFKTSQVSSCIYATETGRIIAIN